MDDLISRKNAIEAITDYIHNVDRVIGTGKLSMDDCRDAAESILEDLPSAEKTGKWIDKTRGDQKNSECSECHTLFRVLIHDYPYCPICGSRNRGDEE